MTRYIIILFLIISVSCSQSRKEKAVVDFSESSSKHTNENLNDKTVYIAIASMTSPKETFTYYNDLVQYISDKVGYPIYIKQKKTYEEVNKLLENDEVDFAFICSGAFTEGYKKGKIKLLVAPEIDQKTSYQAYIITQKDSEINSFRDFENKQFAFTDPLSNTGRLFPLKLLSNLNKNEQDFFQKTIFTYGHDISIQMVNRGIIDGASVHGLIFDYLTEYYPDKVKNIKIIQKSEKFGMPPIVTPVSLDKECFEKYQKVLLDIHQDSIGKGILDKLLINRFVIVEDSIYKSVFELKEYIDNVTSKKNY